VILIDKRRRLKVHMLRLLVSTKSLNKHAITL